MEAALERRWPTRHFVFKVLSTASPPQTNGLAVHSFLPSWNLECDGAEATVISHTLHPQIARAGAPAPSQAKFLIQIQPSVLGARRPSPALGHPSRFLVCPHLLPQTTLALETARCSPAPAVSRTCRLADPGTPPMRTGLKLPYNYQQLCVHAVRARRL